MPSLSRDRLFYRFYQTLIALTNPKMVTIVSLNRHRNQRKYYLHRKMFPLAQFQQLKTSPKLKRSFAVQDLTSIPADTPLDTTIELSIRYKTADSRLEAVIQKQETAKLTIEIDSFAPIIELKRRIEPFAYQQYIRMIETPENLTKNISLRRNIDYYARVKSPTFGSPVSPTSASSEDSDYKSEDGLDENVDTNAMRFANSKDYFLQALELTVDEQYATKELESNAELKNTELVYERINGTVPLFCFINLDKLVFESGVIGQ
jgi:hypothetical protein